MEKLSPLRKFAQDALKKHFGKQASLASALGIQEPVLSDYLNSKRSVAEDFAVKLCEKLGTPLDETILACEAARCEYHAEEALANGDADTARRYETARDSLIRTLDGARRDAVNPLGNVTPRPFTSLQDFPNLKEGPWCVITGDRREYPPASRADLAALSVSSSDLMFLLALKLPPTTLVRSDKIFRILPESQIKELMACNILAIGSPAVSFATREILRRTGATHLFNISHDEYQKERHLSDSIAEADRLDPEMLAKFANQPDVAEAVSQFLPDFRKAGFVDPIDFRGIRGRSQDLRHDYGVVALAPNPWSEAHLVVIAAGVHGPGTAGALQMLIEPEKLINHPWGGVVLVNTPALAPWERLFERHLHPRFETHSYDPKKYISDLRFMIDEIKTDRFSEVKIGEITLKKTLAFAAQLARYPSARELTAG